jgi:hypothetical protein
MIQVAIANSVIYENTNTTFVSIAIKTNYIIIWNTYQIVRNHTRGPGDAKKLLVSKFHTISPP